MVIPAIGPSWPGYSGLKHLVIFGASYCDVGYGSYAPHPTPENPLGVQFPGLTYAEPSEPNWVGHLITSHSRSPLLVYNYALGGARVAGVRRQVGDQFLPYVGLKPEWAPWSSEDTLFITWVGINDCSFTSEHAENMEVLFAAQEELYKVGARNFLFINVPPIHRSPAVGSSQRDRSIYYSNWNSGLEDSASKFVATHPDATAMIFSSWDTFTRVLDDPGAYGFMEEDRRKAGGAIWVDQLHPTSKMHNIIASDLAKFLTSQPAFRKADTN